MLKHHQVANGSESHHPYSHMLTSSHLALVATANSSLHSASEAALSHQLSQVLGLASVGIPKDTGSDLAEVQQSLMEMLTGRHQAVAKVNSALHSAMSNALVYPLLVYPLLVYPLLKLTCGLACRACSSLVM